MDRWIGKWLGGRLGGRLGVGRMGQQFAVHHVCLANVE